MRPFELCVSSELTNLAEISEFVAARARSAGLAEEQVFEIQMATDEACTNSMEHAYEGKGGGEVRVCCWIDGDEFVVRVTDFGRPFDPADIPAPDTDSPLEKRSVGGLGLFFMRKLVDEIEFTSDPIQGNQVVMRKKRQPNRS